MCQPVTNTSEAAPASSPLTVDWSFAKSPTGILFLAQIVCSVLAVVLAGCWGGAFSAGHVLFMMASTAVLLCSSAIFLARLLQLGDLSSTKFTWPIIFACYSGPAALLAVVFSCVMVAAAKGSSLLKAAGVFGLFTWNALLICFLLHFKPFFEKWQEQQRVSDGSPRARSVEEGEASDDWSDDEETETPRSAEVTLMRATVRPSSSNFPIGTCSDHLK